ncbi:MAG TPA: hypothetical protein VNO30_47885 [Kofleriaceae bacterium]|nr:hypothetical protein [Kofleriaceae bacterium]
MRTLAISILAAGAIAAALPRAAHAVPCDQVPGLANPVYLQVGDTQLALMKRLARALRDSAPRPVSLVFTTSGSCTNIRTIYDRTAIPATTNVQYAPSIAENPSWDPATSPTLTCQVPAGGKVPDVANSALFTSACTTETPPATVRHVQGPVQAYVMAVPKASSQTAITFEEAYFAFGFGMAGMAAPWVDESQLFIRTVTKSTLLAWAANISVPADKWKGIRRDGSSMVVADLESSTSPEKALGILGAEVYDSKRSTLKSLAFQARGQYAAYWPDSTPTAFDKQNVRDGHYTVWSPTIWMDTEAGGAPVNADARYVVDMIAGRSVTPAPAFDMIAIIAAVGLTPDCAMGVKRSFEGGPLSRYQPAESCVCKYESRVAQSNCATCTTTCATGVCRNGFCEVR